MTTPLILQVLIIYLIVINLVTFIMYGLDKRKAKNGVWRIPESRLLLFALMGGALGAWFGMKCYRHKTQHLKFRILVPLALLLWTAIIGYVIYRSSF